MSGAVAMHAHEYVHFLHNASTTAGQAYLLSNLMLLRVMAGGCDDQGYFLGMDSMPEEGRNSLRYVAAVMCEQLGATFARELQDCKDVSNWECSPPDISEYDGIPSVVATFSARNGRNESRSQSVNIGLGFITEGIAYEVDREIRHLNGMAESELDSETRIFPYLAYRVLIRSWSGRDLDAHDRIAIGVAALASQFSGRLLVTICGELKNTARSLDSVLAMANKSCLDESKQVLALLRKQRDDLSKGDVIWTAMGEYMRLAEAGVQLRQNSSAPEFAFLSRTMSSEEFRNCIGGMLDCLVIQSKPGKLLEMYWIGPGQIAKDDRSMSLPWRSSIGDAFQSAPYYRRRLRCFHRSFN
ncbi:hypothetical protein EV700_3192 [Fluviicoccus keumensis]|uniref:Uncharacterized protein n=1 Tax=Fluviicoccus keumensis TaxID=1435465 RepID=A0A4V2G3F4_9GAMM|nr:hypothetical protein EV700_3192 [Fluviicoccus keumensis]